MGISRRKFIETAALGGAAASAGLGSASGAKSKLPTRVLGRTGAKVTILAFGCGSRFLLYDDDKAIEAINRGLDMGITYIDTAYGYGKGRSEGLVGQVMKTRRKEVFLATKVAERNAEKAMRIVEASLKRLQTDHVDLLHIHSLSDEKDIAQIEAEDGVLKLLYKLRDQKVARAIGVTSHSDPAVLKTLLERHDFDCTQMALNAGLVGMVNIPTGFDTRVLGKASFENVALPVARKKNMGVIAMKVFAQDHLAGKASPEKLLRYAMSLPVTAAVVGMPKFEHIDANIEVARKFKPMSAAEMEEISTRLSRENKASIDRFFMHHVDC